MTALTVANSASTAPALIGRRPAEIIARVLTGLAAGLAAARDYRHLQGMSDTALRREGLSRADLPRALMRRHFG